MMSNNSDKLVTRIKTRIGLVGGLGNQLFCLAAALTITKSQNSKAIIYLPNAGNSILEELVSIPRTLIIKDMNSIQYRIFNTLARLNQQIEKLKIFGKGFKLTYVSTEVGFDRNWNPSKKFIYILGYFQTWRHDKSLQEERISGLLKPFAPSKYYRNFEQTINYESTIGIHVRRGDYKKIENEYFGLLDLNYYKQAISYIQDQENISTILVFSDDIEGLKFEFSELNAIYNNVIWLDRSYNLTTLEEFHLFSSLKFKIIGNSTFSWWAAWLGTSNSKIIHPDKWFKSRQDPADLFPSNWFSAKSSWITLSQE